MRFTVPAGWRVVDVTEAGGAALPVEHYPLETGGTRLTVRLPKQIAVGQTQTINYRAIFTPAGWMADWTTQQIEFPKIARRGLHQLFAAQLPPKRSMISSFGPKRSSG